MAIATINPATGETVKTFEPHDAAEVERRIALADAATKAMRQTSFAERGAWMRAAADLLEADADEIALIMTTEMGKPLAQARAEALKCVKGIKDSGYGRELAAAGIREFCNLKTIWKG